MVSRLDYCNSLLAGVPQTTLDRLQRVMNTAALDIYTCAAESSVQTVCQGYVPLTLDVMHVAFKVSLAFHTPL